MSIRKIQKEEFENQNLTLNLPCLNKLTLESLKDDKENKHWREKITKTLHEHSPGQNQVSEPIFLNSILPSI